jgi:transcriptional regulator with GAF, ATPase, and Fis domain
MPVWAFFSISRTPFHANNVLLLQNFVNCDSKEEHHYGEHRWILGSSVAVSDTARESKLSTAGGASVDPQLVALSGPLNGDARYLTETEISIGRDPSNLICVDSSSVSRRHCLIFRKEDELFIRDLESLNGTFVNDIPIKERTLSKGDKIAIGDSVFILVIDEDEPAEERGPILSETTMLNLDIVHLSPKDSLYLSNDKAAVNDPDLRVAKDLNALLSLSTSISSIRTLDELQERLLRFVGGNFPAECAAFLSVSLDETEIESIQGWDRSAGIGARVQPSSTVVNQVLTTRTAVLVKKMIADGPFTGAESLVLSRTQSVLCVPMESLGQLVGVVYAGTSDPEHRFDEEHLQLLTAVCSVAALAVQNARQFEFLRGENQRLKEEINLNHNMVGESSAMRQVYQVIAKVAQADSTILVTGESGTGKELVARAIHQNSPRSNKPFVAINCAAIPETLLESELFGTEKGAYTGASQRPGKLEAAEGGTVLLDEIGELPLVVQAKLLRVLQERRFERLGGIRSIPVNVRWIAATNRDLKEGVKSRTFREDLYFRLQVITVRMPPLRERRDDIPLLAGYFALRFSKLCGRPVKGISPQARARLIHYDWPGNIRELENTMERAIVVGSGDYVLPEDLNEDLFEKELPSEVQTPAYHEAVKQAKQRIVRTALDRAGGNVTEAARDLGIHPNNLHRLIRNLGVRPAGSA